MNLDAIKAKLSALNNSGQEREKVDYSATFWKPEIGKSNIRIVPSKFDPNLPFKEVKFHYGIGKYPMAALSNFGKQDPIEEFIKELKKTSDKDNWTLAGKLNPKTRVFAPVVVRGEEEKGVRLWGFGVTIYKALLALAQDEEVGDYTDVINGWDLVVEVAAGNPYPTTSVRIRPKQTPLSDKAELVDAWLNTQPHPVEIHTQYDYEYIKKQLQSYLTPGSAEEEASAAPVDTMSQTIGSHSTDFTLETTAPGMKDTVSKFDDLFNE